MRSFRLHFDSSDQWNSIDEVRVSKIGLSMIEATPKSLTVSPQKTIRSIVTRVSGSTSKTTSQPQTLHPILIPLRAPQKSAQRLRKALAVSRDVGKSSALRTPDSRLRARLVCYRSTTVRRRPSISWRSAVGILRSHWRSCASARRQYGRRVPV